MVFSSPDLLSRSFGASKNIIPNSPESIIPLDYKEIVDSYHLLLNLELEVIENVIINGINALGNSIEIKLKTNKVLEKKDLNQFVIVLLNPNLHSPEYFESALPNILRALTSLPISLQVVLVNYFSKFSSTNLKKILDVFQQLITVRILTRPHAATALSVNDDQIITNSVKAIKIIYYASILGGELERNFKYPNSARNDRNFLNEQSAILSDSLMLSEEKKNVLEEFFEVESSRCRKPLVPYDDFINDCLNDAIEMDRDLIYFKSGGVKFSFLQYPFILNTTTKTLGLFYDNRVRMNIERRMMLYVLLQGHLPSPYLKLLVRRDHLIQDSLVGVNYF